MHSICAVAGLLALITSFCFHWLSIYNLPLSLYWLVLICWSQWCDVIFIVIYVIVNAVATYSYKLAVTLAFDIKVNSFKLLVLDQYRAGARYPILSAAAVPIPILEMTSSIAWGKPTLHTLCIGWHHKLRLLAAVGSIAGVYFLQWDKLQAWHYRCMCNSVDC